MFIKTCENFLVNIDYISSFEFQELHQSGLFEVYVRMNNNSEILLRTFSKEEYVNDFIRALFSEMSLQLSITSNIAPGKSIFEIIDVYDIYDEEDSKVFTPFENKEEV